MTDKPNPLRLPPPVRTADTTLGERLAGLARASTPTPVRRAAWRVPLAAVIVVAGTGGLAYGAQTVVHHVTGPTTVVPGSDLSPHSPSPRRPSPSSAAGVTPLPPAGLPSGVPSTRAAQPTHPARPTHPAHPTQPAHPSHPAHPAQSTRTAHPSHPAHPVRPTPSRRPTQPAATPPTVTPPTTAAPGGLDQHTLSPTTSGGHGG